MSNSIVSSCRRNADVEVASRERAGVYKRWPRRGRSCGLARVIAAPIAETSIGRRGISYRRAHRGRERTMQLLDSRQKSNFRNASPLQDSSRANESRYAWNRPSTDATFFIFHPRNYYKLSLCVTFSSIHLTICRNAEEHMPNGIYSINYGLYI